ncbi:hypothetical protein FJZ21_01445 [Candidatus Pacearchaeota archaeon]|nr:hypothetical protein [Candidatus Pacearchaeota archaeon]
MVIGLINNLLAYIYSLPEIYQKLFTVAVYMVLIFIYSTFIWNVHKVISRKDIISLNLRQYNSFDHPTLNKLFAGILYFIEYIIVLPFLILFWYILFALVLVFFSEIGSIEQILLLSAAVVGSIRLLAYYNHETSAEVAKLLPFTILAITLLSHKFIDVARFNETIGVISDFAIFVVYALFFIILLEIILRFLDLFKRIIMGKD